MKKYICLLLAISCGGDPFTSNDSPLIIGVIDRLDGSPDINQVGQAGQTNLPEAGPMPEAGSTGVSGSAGQSGMDAGWAGTSGQSGSYADSGAAGSPEVDSGVSAACQTLNGVIPSVGETWTCSDGSTLTECIYPDYYKAFSVFSPPNLNGVVYRGIDCTNTKFHLLYKTDGSCKDQGEKDFLSSQLTGITAGCPF